MRCVSTVFFRSAFCALALSVSVSSALLETPVLLIQTLCTSLRMQTFLPFQFLILLHGWRHLCCRFRLWCLSFIFTPLGSGRGVELGVVDPLGRVLQCAMYISPAVVACLVSNLILILAPSLLCPTSLHSFLCAFCATSCLSFNMRGGGTSSSARTRRG